MQTFADVLDRPVRIVDDATWVGVRGAWLATGVATDERAGPGGLACHVEGELLVPDPASDEQRERRYRLFRAATDALRSVHGRP